MNKKNIIIIIIDAFRTKNVSLFGYNKVTDKNLKKIAKDSILLKDFFSCSNATAPSLTSLFTGKYPNNHGIIHQFPYTTQEEIDNLNKVKFWFPSYLQNKGYETIAIDWIGLWFKNGFNYYEEKEEKQSRLKKFMKTPIIKKFLLGLPNWAYKFGKKVVKTRASEQFTPAEDTMNLGISKIQDAVNENKPFFLFMHFWDTHFPFPTTKFKSSGKSDVDEILEKLDKNQREYFKKRITDSNLYSIEDMIDKYDAAIKMVDKQIGKLYKFLKKKYLWDETILIVLGDHGTSLIDHENYFSSSGLFDETIHVPFIMHLPGFEGKEIDGLVQNVDILPTIIGYLKEDINEKFDGKSILPLIENNKEIRDKVFFFDG
ncbi:MAG: sulfatase, partial [Nanoarchaeota archaeon]